MRISNVTDLRTVLSREEYESCVKEFIEWRGRPPKAPSYDNLCSFWDTQVKAMSDPSILPFVIVDSAVITVSGRKIPLPSCRDEAIHDRVDIISYVFLEDVSYDMLPLFSGQNCAYSFLDNSELEYVHQGMQQPCVVIGEEKPLKRHRRYQKLITDVQIVTDVEQIIKDAQYLNEKAKEYWKSKGVTPNITDDVSRLVGLFTGCGFDDIIGIKVWHGDTFGIGVFTQTENDELYWDFSRNSGAAHLGNNILLEAVDYAKKEGLSYLNLGVPYYKWKWEWSRAARNVGSLRYKQNSSIAKEIKERYLRQQHLYNQVNSNTDRKDNEPCVKE